MTSNSEEGAAAQAVPAPPRGSRLRNILLAVIAVVAVDVLAAILVPQPGFPDIGASINANIEPIPPKTVIDFAPNNPIPNTSFVVTAHPSITTTMLTMWIIMAILVAAAFLLTRRLEQVPGTRQNLIEYVVETARNFVADVGGTRSMRYVSLFGTLFLFILLSNWSDLFLFGEKSDVIRTPTSDINTTVGLALVSFCVFHIEGIRVLGLRHYLGKFFTLAGFRKGIFDGFIDMYVGLLEFFLEFFKPVTLSVRLFGNIYGGGIMLGVMTSLLIAVIPLPFLLLEGFVGLVQALIFALLTLLFTLTALESHEEDAHEAPAFATDPEDDLAAPIPRRRREGAPAPAVQS